MQSKGKQATTQLFQKSLSDLVRGIRKHKKNEQDYIQKAIQEIKEELKHRDIHVKVIAVQKMTYLHMIGYNMEYGAFTIVEVMSSPSDDFTHKRIGYLACAQCFHEKVDLIQMIPNLLRNGLRSANQWEQGLALSCISNICTPELAELLVSECVQLLGSQRPYVKKKTLLTLFKMFLQYPSALRPCFPRIKEKLDDPDPSVTAASVNVICELARRNPKNYLGMAPIFFKLFSNIQNNWTLIKIVKVFGALAPEEPRLPKKLAEPLSQCIQTTPAKSLLYEAVLVVAANAKPDSSIMALAVEQLKQFVESPDTNLKYLGLKGLAKVMKSSPQQLTSTKDLIIECLGDEDPSIRIRALDLVGGLVSKRSIQSVIAKMQEQLAVRDDDDFRNTIVKYIVDMCRQQQYAFVTNFEWYLRVLMDLTQANIQHFEHGGLLEEEFMNVVVRVEDVRPFGIKCVSALLCNAAIYQKAEDSKSSLARVLKAANYLASEYPQYVPNKQVTVGNLMKKRVLAIPADIQAAALQTCLKLYAYVCNPDAYRRSSGDDEESEEDENIPNDETTVEGLILELLPPKPVKSPRAAKKKSKKKKKKKAAGSDSDSTSRSSESEESEEESVGPEDDKDEAGLGMFLSSSDVDVREHATVVKALIETHQEMRDVGDAPVLGEIFCEPLRTVRVGAQEVIDPPSDIDERIVMENPQFSDDESSEATMSSSSSSSSETRRKRKKKLSKTQQREEEKRREAEAEARRNNPHYLPSAPAAGARGSPSSDDLPPVQSLADAKDSALAESFNLGTRGFKEKKSKKGKKEAKAKRHRMNLDDDVPEGYDDSPRAASQPAKAEKAQGDGVWAALDMDLSGPVKEALPELKAYERKDASDYAREAKRKERERKKRAADSDDESEKGKKGKKDKKEKKGKKEKREEEAEKKEKKSKKDKKAKEAEPAEEKPSKKDKKDKKAKEEREEEPEKKDKKAKKEKKPAAADDVVPADSKEGVLATAEVTECTRQKKGNTLRFDVAVTITNKSGQSIKNLAVKGKKVDVEQDEGKVKASHSETCRLTCSFELAEVQEVKATVSYTSKDGEKGSVKVVLVRGMADCMAAVSKKLTRDAFFGTMQEMNEKDSGAVTAKRTLKIAEEAAEAVIIPTLQTKMNFKAVEVLDSCAAVMGTLLTPTGKHTLCLLVKQSGAGQTTLELKTLAPGDVADDVLAAIEKLLLAVAPPATSPRKGSKSPTGKKDKKAADDDLAFLDM